MKSFMVFVLIFACFSCYYAQESTNFYCGRTLSRALAVLCYGAESKRDAGWWIPQHGHHALAGVRGKRGPVDECCEKACSIQELMTYC
uniref:Insulin-related peptide 1 n=1 Tax=Agrotis ipsilon TaxID=56364 RepID=IRP1_AGRIP|nr:RecName: Full=Insulin-related peptide 1; Short=IRP-1; Contains: RecName: Full=DAGWWIPQHGHHALAGVR-amide; Flags: Precursor [Agrotis ipsilon]